jgi:hypothetical protein
MHLIRGIFFAAIETLILNFYFLLHFDIFRYILSSLQGFVFVLSSVQSACSGRIISIKNSIFYTPNPCWFHLEDIDMNTGPNPCLTCYGFLLTSRIDRPFSYRLYKHIDFVSSRVSSNSKPVTIFLVLRTFVKPI